MSLELIGVALIAVWLTILTVYVIYTTRSVNTLTKGVEKGDLITILDKVLKSEKKTSSDIADIRAVISSMSQRMQSHIQKVGLVRYNPFEELGGDHSFSLVLLDEKETGFLVTGLHTRERTRVYMKEIQNGTCSTELSKDEKKALEMAKGK